MAFIGTPLDTRNTFQSLQGKRFNGDGSTTAFTLDVAPSSTLDIEVFVGNVRQDPNSAYTLSGTTLTFTGAPPSGTNNIYVVHQAKSVGTINAPANSVNSAQLNTALLTGATDIGANIADADLFLVDDGAGGTLRKTAASRIKTYVGGFDVSSITGATELAAIPATTDEFVISDGGVLKRIDFTHIQSTLVPISSVALTGNTNPVRFDDVFTSTHTLYQIHLSDLTPQSDGVQVRFRWRNGSSTLEASNTYEYVSTTVQSDSSSATIKNVNNDDCIQIGKDGFGHSAARSGINGIIQVHSPQATGNYKSMHYDLKSADSDGFTLFCTQGNGAFKDDTSTTIEGFELTCSSNGFSSGRIDIYGVKQVA